MLMPTRWRRTIHSTCTACMGEYARHPEQRTNTSANKMPVANSDDFAAGPQMVLARVWDPLRTMGTRMFPLPPEHGRGALRGSRRRDYRALGNRQTTAANLHVFFSDGSAAVGHFFDSSFQVVTLDSFAQS